MPAGTDRAVVVDMGRSAYARLRPVPLAAVLLDDPIWAPRRRLVREQILVDQYHHLELTHRIDNFRRAAGKQAGSFEGFFFNYSWTLSTR